MPSPLRLVPALAMMAMAAGPALGADCVVLLHGLARTTLAMETLAGHFSENGFTVVNRGYPSREQPIEVLAPLAVETGARACPAGSTVHFVTHSLGGILVRYYMQHHERDFPLGRVVMIAPPNQGSEVVDALRDVPGYAWLNGPAGAQLGTDPDSIPSQLGPVTFDTGVIAGTRSINLILSLLLPNPDDGKVSVSRTRVDGMHDFITLPHSHPLILESDAAVSQALHFIQHGTFDKESNNS